MNKSAIILAIILYIAVPSICIIDVNTVIFNNMHTNKLIIDTDGGGDDANAILLVLSAWKAKLSNFQVIGITCTNGNTEEINVEENVLKMLTIANTSFIPVYRGSQNPLLTTTTSNYYFGKDGLGDFKFDKIITATIDESFHAAIALIKYAKLYPGELNILALGPLTNVAIAIRLDPEFVYNIKRLYIMGGSITGLGNIKPGKEFNFAIDPISAFITLDSFSNKSCFLFPWDTVIVANITKTWREKQLGVKKSEIVKFLNKVEAKALNDSSSDVWSASDVMCASVMMWPELITEIITHNVLTITEGEGKGAIIVDYNDVSGKPKNVQIVKNFNVTLFQEKILKLFS